MSSGDASQQRPRLAVFLSGSGRTMVNLAEVIARGELRAEIALVVASRRCKGADRARELGLPALVIEGDIPESELIALLDEHRIEWVVLAGYLRLMPVPDRWAGRVVNIHPALLPDFGGPGMYGTHVHKAVLASGAAESGCTVHLCDGRYDTGPIVLQRRCPVLEGDTAEDLADRVFEQELEAYPQALRMLLEGEWGRQDTPRDPNKAQGAS